MTTDITTMAPVEYPVRYAVEYPEGARNRVTVAFRLLLMIPIVILFTALSSSGMAGWNAGGGADGRMDAGGARGQFEGRAFDAGPGPLRSLPAAQRAAIIAAVASVALVALIFGPAAIASALNFSVAASPLVGVTALMLLFRRKYPRWWFDFTLEVARFGGRVGAYAALQRDEYPSTDEPQGVRVEIDYPDAMRLNRWLPLVKWLLAIPHYVVLFFLYLGLVVVTFIAWFAILLTGRYPRSLFDYSVGTARWTARVSGYAFWLVTDRYPPFSLR